MENKEVEVIEKFDEADIAANKVMAVLSYLGPLFLIPLLAAKNSKFARYHCNQGIILFIADVIYGLAVNILTAILPTILSIIVSLISSVGGILIFVLAILGIVNACKGEAKPLPIIGGFSILK